MQWHGMRGAVIRTHSQHSITIRHSDAARGRTEYITRRKVPSGLRPPLGPPTGLGLLLPRGSDEPQLCRRCLEARENLINSLSTSGKIEP